MPVINPSKSFQGSEMGKNDSSIIKPGVRRIAFSDPKYKEGIYLFILPPYKQDRDGNGVWYRVIDVRDNFGVDTKERIVETDGSPIAYFAKQVKIKHPSYAEIQKIQREGRDTKIYPSFGRISRRVLFNTAFVQDLSKGAHVIEVPNWGCADQIDKYHRKPTVTGAPVDLVCNPKQATPVFFKLDKDAKGQPWIVIVDSGNKYAIPDALADSDNLYNLDDVLVTLSTEELLFKLRQVTPPDIFDDCMQGYTSGTGVTVSMTSSHPHIPTAAPKVEMVAAVEIPKANIPVAMPTGGAVPVTSGFVTPAMSGMKIPPATITPMDNRVTVEATSVESNPMGGISAEDAKKWLKQKRA